MNVIITTVPEKLPENVRALIEENTPLPPNVSFFEERFTASDAITKTIIGVALIGIGTLLSLFGVYDIVHTEFGIERTSIEDFLPLIVGVVFLVGGYMLVASLRARMKLMRDQQGGVATRYGIFLIDDMLVSRSWFDTTVIPRPFFKGLKGHAVHYEFEAAAKSFTLPKQIVGRDAAEMERSIATWAAQGAKGV